MYKILLIGGEFVNKGAEAMIFSTKSLLEKYSVDPKIVVATYEKKNVGTKYQGLTVIGNKWLKGKAILYVKLLVFSKRTTPIKLFCSLQISQSNRFDP